MKKFVFKISVFILLMIVFMVGEYVLYMKIIPPQYSAEYSASIFDKLERLSSIEEPKIILVGNSNLAFGICSELIEDELQMPVVNLGLHGGMGNPFHEKMAKQNIGESDIVIVCHSDYDSDKIISTELAWSILENNDRLWQKFVGREDYIEMYMKLPQYTGKKIKKWIFDGDSSKMDSEDIYVRDAFNQYGDVGRERLENKHTIREGDIEVPIISEKCVERLNSFNEFCQERGAVLLIAGYPIWDCEFTPNKKEYIAFQEELEAQMDCEVISDYTDYFMPGSYFYDTVLHLTTEGARIRTCQLISDLKEYMK